MHQTDWTYQGMIEAQERHSRPMSSVEIAENYLAKRDLPPPAIVPKIRPGMPAEKSPMSVLKSAAKPVSLVVLGGSTLYGIAYFVVSVFVAWAATACAFIAANAGAMTLGGLVLGGIAVLASGRKSGGSPAGPSGGTVVNNYYNYFNQGQGPQNNSQ